jgi:hypothetical protein
VYEVAIDGTVNQFVGFFAIVNVDRISIAACIKLMLYFSHVNTAAAQCNLEQCSVGVHRQSTW